MFVSAEHIVTAERLYGAPRELSLKASVNEEEFNFIRSTQRNGRAHDITLIIYRLVGGAVEIAVMNKHGYPAGLFRPPSGGLHEGESFDTGSKREAFEETGLEIELTKYLLRVVAPFHSPSRTLHWTTHVFMARALTEEITVHDLKEIREAKWAPLSIFDEFDIRSQSFDRGGIRYRRDLHREIVRDIADFPFV